MLFLLNVKIKKNYSAIYICMGYEGVPQLKALAYLYNNKKNPVLEDPGGITKTSQAG